VDFDADRYFQDADLVFGCERAVQAVDAGGVVERVNVDGGDVSPGKPGEPVDGDVR
jgi:hypothetical protein